MLIYSAMAVQAPTESPWRSRLRVAGVVLLALVLLTFEISSEVVRLWVPQFTYGFVASNLTSGERGFVRVDRVDPKSPAAAAGLAVGDQFDLLDLDLRQRLIVMRWSSALRDDSVTLTLQHDGATKTVAVRAAQAQFPRAAKIKDALLRFTEIIFILIGAALVLLRPSVMTWAFYALALGVNDPGIGWFVGWYVSPQVDFALILADYGFFVASLLGFAVFAIRFPDDVPIPAGRWFERAVPYLFVALLLNEMAIPVMSITLGMAPTLPTFIEQWAEIVLIVTGCVYLVLNYLAADPVARQKLNLVLGAILIVGIVDVSQRLRPPTWEEGWWQLIFIIMPVAVAYGVIRYRVFDINVLVSRALVFGILTTMLLIGFLIIEFFMHRILADTRLNDLLQFLVATSLGFALSRLHGTVERFVSRVFFHKRYMARRRLEALARELRRQSSHRDVDRLLVTEPAESLDLASAAAFRRDGENRFVREAAQGWDGTPDAPLTLSTAVIQRLEDVQNIVRLRVSALDQQAAPTGVARPILALPVIHDDRMQALVLYGAHTDGGDIDALDLRALSGLAIGACAAYEHIEADQLREEVMQARREIEQLRARLG